MREGVLMNEQLLKMNGLSVKILDMLSFESHLEIPLKKNLHYFDKESLIEELIAMTEWLDEQELLSEIALDYRIKSLDSILMKYERYYPDHQTRKVFNDILGFRAFCDSYEQILEEKSPQFRIADMTKGKSVDDGYRGVHVYYQKSGRHYPIEIQFNTLFDRQLNNWLHDNLYKKNYSIETGKIMRDKYESGFIRNEHEFKEVLNNVLFDSERS
jgi:ppGpp synthetase/RelA/SpoT-type nucleotidyltranferase